ncbi:MAG: VanW family protein [Acidobacteriota bacterium]|nr:VanW family protein [Acidobacteriota bacterium]
MKEAAVLPIEPKIHTRNEALVFRAKAFLLQLKRGAENLVNFADVRRFPKTFDLNSQPVIGESKTALWTEKDRAEMPLMAGKIHNLRLAIGKLNGVEIPANQTFSFWKHVGRATRRKGFVRGRELREGCVIPNVGGGLCQLSNALYDAALQANFEIVERHAHTQIVQGSLAEKGRDATVFWNYVDLRFRSSNAFRVEAELTATHLIVRFRSEKKKQNPVQIKTRREFSVLNNQPNSCMTCGVGECFRSEKTAAADDAIDFGGTAFLLDEYAKEFDEYIRRTREKKDFLFVPLDGKRFKKANYAWSGDGFAKMKQSFFVTLLRSYKSRKLAAQGAARQKSLLAMAEKLAESYAKQLTFDATQVVVAQNLLPFLWKNGHLGGRTFDVLMTALPMSELQKRLDFAASLHPESKTLGDFRAAEWLVEAETKALQNARKIITPHAEIAALFAEKAEPLDWQMPEAKEFKRKRNEKFTVVFPASTVGRKGCYELRDALRGLDVKLVTLGAIIEDADFWSGFDWEKGSAADCLERADLVVLPAFVEHKPRRLLQAAAHKIPVIASRACGAENVPGITSVSTGDSGILREEIEKILKANERVSENDARMFV